MMNIFACLLLLGLVFLAKAALSSERNSALTAGNTKKGLSSTWQHILHIRAGAGAVIEIEDFAQLKEIMDSSVDKLVVIDFTATWCGPCKMIAPMYQTMAEENEDIVFLKVDVDKCADIAQEFGVSAMPTFLFIKNGDVVDRFAGASVQKLKETIEKYM